MKNFITCKNENGNLQTFGWYKLTYFQVLRKWNKWKD